MKLTRPTPGPRYQALLQLLRTAETLWNASRLFCARWDLSPSQFNILNLLQGEPDGVTQIELSRELIMHRSNVTGLVDRLEARGLVRRAESSTDRRAWRVQLTPAGEKLIAEILPHYYGAAEAIWGGVSVAHARLLVEDLAQITANLERIEKEIT